mgnify:CR=1 FL=1
MSYSDDLALIKQEFKTGMEQQGYQPSTLVKDTSPFIDLNDHSTRTVISSTRNNGSIYGNSSPKTKSAPAIVYAHSLWLYLFDTPEDAPVIDAWKRINSNFSYPPKSPKRRKSIDDIINEIKEKKIKREAKPKPSS